MPSSRSSTHGEGPPEAVLPTGLSTTAYYRSLRVVRVVDRDRRLVVLLVGDLGVEGDGLPLLRVLHLDLAAHDVELRPGLAVVVRHVHGQRLEVAALGGALDGDRDRHRLAGLHLVVQ